jgi:hypothetical protein
VAFASPVPELAAAAAAAASTFRAASSIIARALFSCEKRKPSLSTREYSHMLVFYWSHTENIFTSSLSIGRTQMMPITSLFSQLGL